MLLSGCCMLLFGVHWIFACVLWVYYLGVCVSFVSWVVCVLLHYIGLCCYLVVCFVMSCCCLCVVHTVGSLGLLFGFWSIFSCCGLLFGFIFVGLPCCYC